jgi:hypothetical protein
LKSSGLFVCEAVRVHAVDHDEIQSAPECVADAAFEFEHLANGHLLGERDADVAGCHGIREHLVQTARLYADGAAGGGLGDSRGGGHRAQGVTGGGRVDDHEVVREGPRAVRGTPGEVEQLAGRDELLCAGRGGDEVGERG